MQVRAATPSVLVVSANSEVLIQIAKILDDGGIRALLARNTEDAIRIAEQGYVPMDLVLADLALPEGNALGLVCQIRGRRPAVRALYMSAKVEGSDVRVDLREAGPESAAHSSRGMEFLEAVRRAATTPLARHA